MDLVAKNFQNKQKKHLDMKIMEIKTVKYNFKNPFLTLKVSKNHHFRVQMFKPCYQSDKHS